jgi:hypothetical protein
VDQQRTPKDLQRYNHSPDEQQEEAAEQKEAAAAAVY